MRSPPIVYVRTGPRPLHNGKPGPAPAVPAEVLSWTARVKLPDGTERDVAPDDLETFAYHTATDTDPVRNAPSDRDDRYDETHPSYGTIQATHSSGYTNLFGCRVDGTHSITLRVTMGATVRVGDENSYSEGECSVCGTTHTEPDNKLKGEPCGSTTYCKGRYVLVTKSRRIVK